jgi:integrase
MQGRGSQRARCVTETGTIARTKAGAGVAAVRLRDVRRRLGLGLDPGTPGITVGQWLEGWLDGKRRTRRASTVRGYESHVRLYLVPAIGDLPLERLNAGHVEAVLTAVPGSAATRHRVYATLSSALSAAVKQRQIPWNPCAGIELEPENPAEAQRWTPEQAARFLAHVAGDPMGLMFRVMVLRGCRRAELVGFRWAGADLDRGVLTVARTVLSLGGKLHEEATAKSRAGDRLVFLDARTAEMLREHRTAQLRARMAMPAGAWQDHDLVFCQPDGRPWNPDHVSKRFKKLAAGAGVPPIKLHEGGRHTGNSLMRDAGVDQEVRMREVGHAGKEINDRYTHVLIEAHLAAAEQTAALVDKAGS